MVRSTGTALLNLRNKPLLGIDTSGRSSCVAVVDGGRILASEEVSNTKITEELVLLVQRVLLGARIELEQLGAVCVCIGPGSFTGLRSGIACCQGLAYAAGCPLAAVPLLPARLVVHNPPEGKCVARVRASSEEYFFATYEVTARGLQEIAPAACGKSDEIDLSLPVFDLDSPVLNPAGACAMALGCEGAVDCEGRPLWRIQQWDEPLRPLYVKAVYARTLAERGLS